MKLQRVYECLGLSGFADVRPKLEAYIEGLGTFAKNAHRPVSNDMKQLIGRRWGPSFREFGYDTLLD